MGLVNLFLENTTANNTGNESAPEFTAQDLDLIAEAEAIANAPELAVA